MCGGSILSRIQGYPQDERRQRERERERTDWGCAAESDKSLFFTIAFIF